MKHPLRLSLYLLLIFFFVSTCSAVKPADAMRQMGLPSGDDIFPIKLGMSKSQAVKLLKKLGNNYHDDKDIGLTSIDLNKSIPGLPPISDSVSASLSFCCYSQNKVSQIVIDYIPKLNYKDKEAIALFRKEYKEFFRNFVKTLSGAIALNWEYDKSYCSTTNKWTYHLINISETHYQCDRECENKWEHYQFSISY